MVGMTRPPYSYVTDNPLSSSDPAGLWGWNPIADVQDAAGEVGNFVVLHHQTIEQVATVVAAGVADLTPKNWST